MHGQAHASGKLSCKRLTETRVRVDVLQLNSSDLVANYRFIHQREPRTNEAAPIPS